MTVYADGVFLLNFLVDFLLLMGAGKLCGHSVRVLKTLLAAVLGGIYACACLLPGFGFLGNLLWRMVSLCAMSAVAYGLSVSALRKGVVFAFLCFALGGAVSGMGKGGLWGILSAAAVVFFLCAVGFREKIGHAVYVPVELSYGEKHLHLTALQDTGNTLTDPITGRQVLVVGAETARQLTGLTRQQLRNPVESIGVLPGLRLIPCHTVGGSQFLLGMRLDHVKIGKWQGSSLVAFAPEGLSTDGAYQALTGG